MIDIHSYKGHTIDYVNRREGYIVHLNGHFRVDYVFDTVEQAKEYIDKST